MIYYRMLLRLVAVNLSVLGGWKESRDDVKESERVLISGGTAADEYSFWTEVVSGQMILAVDLIVVSIVLTSVFGVDGDSVAFALLATGLGAVIVCVHAIVRATFVWRGRSNPAVRPPLAVSYWPAAFHVVLAVVGVVGGFTVH